MKTLSRKILILSSVVIFLFALSGSRPVLAVCTGSFLNPITDVCWSCMFPIKIGSISYGNAGEQTPTDNTAPVCACWTGSKMIIGVSTAFWEHARLIESVKDPYCFPTLGTGLTNPQPGLQGGDAKTMGENDTDQSFQQVHYYVFPVWQILQLWMDFPCVESNGFDLAYMTEVDPMWSDDSLSFLINPEALLFGNPVTQLSCISDSVAATMGYPLDPLFWCFGSWGSAYPLTGTTAENNPLNANANVASRMIFKLGREGALWDTGISQCSSGVLTPIMIKSHYKLQIARPVKGSQCIPIGRPSLIWGSAKNPPMGAANNSPDNFLWVMTRKRICCVGYNILDY